ncbi:sensor histidine kinase [Bacillus horti]|uniref:histidine kinase n=1 Tax=Caldalkalibacillus horti TaxID=77523 RepID=A0ABT9VWF4_9BACI|nr:HAMP domain-containing sensor histidine kinase [Bacillus horti]MDQ0165311.1 signal transduction histidine kinase [Bacillus horti]
MKWKLTGRYLFSILSIVFIVLVVNTVILIGMLIYQQTRGIEEVTSGSAETFTRDFGQYMTLGDEEPVVSQDGKQALEEFGAWIQILDDNGQVLSSYLAPDTASNNYTLMEIVHKYKYMDDEFNTYFLGEYEGFSYIVGVPYSRESRFVRMINVESIVSFASKSLIVITIVDLIIAALIGLLFSTILTKPVNSMIERISQLKHRNFYAQHPQRTGVFKPVFSNLNDVSETLMEHENERLKLEKMRNEWISNVSHDLKTPLASVQGYAELLRDEDVPVHERLAYAEVIERQSIYMKNLLDDFNLTMRLKNQEVTLELQETRMESFVREIVIDLLNDSQYGEREISFTSDAPELKLSIDQHLMKRALFNFAYNALIHNDDNTAVSITIQDEFISIEDNGKGIPVAEQAKIFDRYYRGTNTDSRGTGLGMAIARDIIEAHGMEVGLESQAGKGTSIRIWYTT